MIWKKEKYQTINHIFICDLLGLKIQGQYLEKYFSIWINLCLTINEMIFFFGVICFVLWDFYRKKEYFAQFILLNININKTINSRCHSFEHFFFECLYILLYKYNHVFLNHQNVLGWYFCHMYLLNSSIECIIIFVVCKSAESPFILKVSYHDILLNNTVKCILYIAINLEISLLKPISWLSIPFQ